MSWQTRFWQKRCWLSYLLLPFSYLFYALSLLRKYFFKLISTKQNLPVIVVGNISVGGNGKTPVLIAIANYLTLKGYRVAIISRGYKAQTKNFPMWCDHRSSALACGDEPVMIAQQTLLPVIIDPNRNRAISAIAQKNKFDLILSDDGLQHYKMKRLIEVAVVGSKAALGNRLLLPAGPLREPVSRLKSVDFVIGEPSLPYVHYPIYIKPIAFYSVTTDKEIEIERLKKNKIQVISGIALPERFHALLSSMGLEFSVHSFPDHHHFTQRDFVPYFEKLILMTEKDAVKCKELNLKNAYYLKIKVNLDDKFLSELLIKLGLGI